MDYTKAYPTEYLGIKYRSRLEARWAAFFNQLGWVYEYEPMDLGSWSPDFLIRPTGMAGGGMLVEVKPIMEMDEETISKMASACNKKGVLNKEETGISCALLVGLSPMPWPEELGPVQIGWLIDDRCSEGRRVFLTWTADHDEPKLNCDVTLIFAESWFSVLQGDADRGCADAQGVRFYRSHVEACWARACNAVQWRRPQ